MALRRGVLILWFSILSFSTALTQTQLIDSLVNQLVNAREDTMKVRMLNHLAFAFYRINPDTTVELASAGLELARKLDFISGQGIALQRIGLGYNSLGKSDLAIDFYEQSLVVLRASGDSINVSATLRNLGSAFYGQARFDDAFEVFQQALVIAEAAGNKRRMAGLLNKMGVVEHGQSNYPSALDFYQRSLALKEELGLVQSASSTIQNIGNIYLSLKDYNKARAAFDRALELKIEANDQTGQAIVLNNLGAMTLEINRPAEALKNFQTAFRINATLQLGCAINYSINGIAESLWRLDQYDSALYYSKMVIPKIKECQDQELLGAAQAVLGAVYFDKGEYSKAEQVLIESVQTSQEITNNLYLQRSTALLSALYKKQGKYKQALAYHELYKAATDSNFNDSNTREITQLEAQFEFDKERRQLEIENEKALLIFDEELKRQALIRNGIIGGSVLLILLAFNYYRSFRIKQRSDKLLEVKNKQLTELSKFKESLTSMIAHDLKNPLNAILGLSVGKVDQNKMGTIHRSGRQMLNMVNNILDVQRFEEAKMNLITRPYAIRDMVKEAILPLQLLIHAKQLEVNEAYDKTLTVAVDPDIITRVIGNLLSNAVKFSDIKSAIDICTETKSDMVNLSITDYGTGIKPEEADHVFNKFWQDKTRERTHKGSTGLGLTFCKLAVKAHGGNLIVKSEYGKFTTFSFSLPIVDIDSVKMRAGFTAGESKSQSLVLDSDILVLNRHISRLEQMKVFEVGKIMRVLKDIDQENFQSPWKEAVISAMHEGNQDKYDELISILK